MTRSRLHALLGAIVLLNGGAACGGEVGSNGTGTSSGGTVTHACIPGEQIVCACGGGQEGAQRCLPDGSGFGACEACSTGSTGGTGAGGTSSGTTGTGGTGTGGTGTGGSGGGGAGVAMLQGAVEKGPFVLGSTVTVSVVDANGDPTGATYVTQTMDDAGSFGLANVPVGGVSFQAEGFYYNEVSGSLSKAPVTLRAFAAITGGVQPAYVNVVTHLTHDRVYTLLGQGMALSAAITQAEAELVAALGIGGPGFVLTATGSSLHELGGDDDNNAYLFALSAIIAQAAVDAAGPGGSVEAAIQQLLNTLAASLAASGTLDAMLVTSLHTAEHELDVDLAEDRLVAYLATQGVNDPIPDLDRVLDTDGDGYVNKVDTCALVANPTQAIIPPGVICRVKRHILFEPAANSGVLFGDLDGDGHIDAFNPYVSPSVVLFGTASGIFSAPVMALGPAAANGQYQVVDMDGDQHVDLFAAYNFVGAQQASGWAKGDGAGNFGPVVPFDQGIVGGTAGACPPGSPCAYRGGALGKWNGSQYPDLLRVWNAQPFSQSFLCLNPSAAGGVFGQSTITPLPAGFPALQPFGQGQVRVQITPGDFNHDGKLDAYIAWDGHTLFAHGQGGYVFGPFKDNPVGDPFQQFGDVNGDGNIDVVSDPTSVAFGDGTGALPSFGMAWSGGEFTGLVLADVDGDGKPEIVLLDADGKLNIIAYVGGAFQAPQVLPMAPAPNLVGYLSVADLDGNGKPDIIMRGASNAVGTVLVPMLIAP